MSNLPKPKSNAVLKNLPEDRQAQIAEWCAKPNDRDDDGNPIPGTGGLAFARSQLAADGLKVSLQTLSEFFSWWQLQQDLKMSFDVEDQVLAATGNVQVAREAAESLLLRLGIARQDADLILAAAKTGDSRRSLDLQEKTGKTKAEQNARKLELMEQQLRLSERRVEVLEAKAKTATETLQDENLSTEQKTQRMREIFGIA